MRKILFFLCGIYNGGTEIELYNLLKKIDKKKYELYVAFSDKENSDTVMVNKIKTYAKQIEITDKHQMDVVVYCTEALDEIDQIKENIKYEKAYFWFHYFWEDQEMFLRRVVKNNEVDKVIAVSQSSKKELLELGCFEDEKQIDVIYNILDTDKIKEGAKEKLNKPLGKDLNFVTVSRIAPIKRFDRIEKFVQVLQQKQIDFKWFIVGKVKESDYSEYAKQMKARLNQYPQISFEGEQENPFKYMKACDYTMVLSDRETWSLATTESKIVGTPCVITDFGAAFEQIEDGKNGIIIERENEEYEKQVEKMLENKQNLRENLKGFEYPIEKILEDWDKEFKGKLV